MRGFRWARVGLQFDNGSGASYWHTVRDSLFEKCQTGLYLNLPSGGVSLVNVQKCNVTTPITGCCYWTGTITDSPLCTDKSFLALRNNDVSDYAAYVQWPPDTMGAVGPSHFVANIQYVIAVFNKTSGTLQEWTDIGTFFGANVPADPRIIYDQQCQRWIACVADKADQSRNVRLAVSRSSDPSGLTTNWDKYTLPVAEPGFYPDFPTLGADANGIYIAVHLYQPLQNPTAWMQKVVAIKKQTNCLTVINPSDIHVLPPLSSPYIWFVIQATVNFDAVAADGIAWFVAKGQGQPGPIQYGRLKWINGTPQFLEDPWNNSLSAPQSYFDLDNNFSFSAPQKPYGDNNQGITMNTGSRLMMAVVRNGHLWTCQHVGLNAQGSYNGDPESALRTGCQWFKLQISTDGQSLSIADHNRIYDNASSSPYFYYFPSLMVNSAGDMVMGFSGSRDTEHIGAFYPGRRANGAQPNKPILIQAGRSYFDFNRWGDYSYTSLDPNDGLTFWTIQQYAETPAFGHNQHYGLCVTKIMKNP